MGGGGIGSRLGWLATKWYVELVASVGIGPQICILFVWHCCAAAEDHVYPAATDLRVRRLPSLFDGFLGT